MDLEQPKLAGTHLTNHAFSSIHQKEQQGCTWTITCYTQQAYNTPRRIDLGQPKLVAEPKVRTHLTNHAFQAFIRKSNRDVLGPLPATHTTHTTHPVVLT